MKKKLLFFITSLAGGGAERVLVNMVNHLSKEKYDITVQTLFDVGINKQYLDPDIEYKYVYKRVRRGISKYLLLFDPEKLYKRFVKGQYDIVVSYFQGPTTRIIAACPYENTKKVQWVHNEFHDRKKITSCYRSQYECLTLQNKYDASVYVSKTVMDAYLKTFPEIKNRDIVLYNVVESDTVSKMALEPISNEKGLFSADINLVSVGRLVPQKSYDRLINVFSILVNRKYDVKLIILGEGELEQTLKKQVESLGLEGRITFLGYQSNPFKYVKRADLFVCSSLHEGYSTAVTEALILGTPVITTECSGMQELLGDNEFGIIVDNDEDSLLRGIESIINNPNELQRLRERSRQRGASFCIEDSITSIESFFDSL